jgi:hypothetical protein
MTMAQVKDALENAEEVSLEKPRPLYRKLAPAEPFPVQALGSALAKAAVAIQARTQAPMALCAQSVLASATLAVQAHANIELPTGQNKPLSCYFLTIAGTGERKSTVDNLAIKAVQQREADLRDQDETDRKSWKDQNEIWEKERSDIIKENPRKKGDAKITAASRQADLDALGDQPKEPLAPIITCEEPTFEGLCRLLAIGQPSLGVFSAEGGQFIGGHGMSDENKLRTSAGLSNLWDGSPIKRVRSGDGSSTLPGRRVAMHLMAQPDVARRMLSDRVLADQGLLSRYLVVAPETAAGSRFFQEVTREVEIAINDFTARTLQILETPPDVKEGTLNELTPRIIKLSDQARAGWIGYSNQVEELLKPGMAYEPIVGLANKLAEHAGRLAAVLTLYDDLNASEVSAEAMANGIALANHYASEALRLFNSSMTDPDLVLAKMLFDWLCQKKLKVVGLRNIYQNGPTNIRTANIARKIMAILEDHGWVSVKEDGETIDGVHQKEVWNVRIPQEFDDVPEI